MDYEAFRAFADTWGLLLLVIVFGAAAGFALRRGARDTYHKAARIAVDADEHGPVAPRAPTASAEAAAHHGN